MESVRKNVDKFFTCLKMKFKILERCYGTSENVNGISIQNAVVILHKIIVRMDQMEASNGHAHGDNIAEMVFTDEEENINCKQTETERKTFCVGELQHFQ